MSENTVIRRQLTKTVNTLLKQIDAMHTQEADLLDQAQTVAGERLTAESTLAQIEAQLTALGGPIQETRGRKPASTPVKKKKSAKPAA